MNNIIDPSDNQAYSIHSKNGKRLLKNYIKFYNDNMNTQTGGMWGALKNAVSTACKLGDPTCELEKIGNNNKPTISFEEFKQLYKKTYDKVVDLSRNCKKNEETQTSALNDSRGYDVYDVYDEEQSKVTAAVEFGMGAVKGIAKAGMGAAKKAITDRFTSSEKDINNIIELFRSKIHFVNIENFSEIFDDKGGWFFYTTIQDTEDPIKELIKKFIKNEEIIKSFDELNEILHREDSWRQHTRLVQPEHESEHESEHEYPNGSDFDFDSEIFMFNNKYYSCNEIQESEYEENSQVLMFNIIYIQMKHRAEEAARQEAEKQRQEEAKQRQAEAKESDSDSDEESDSDEDSRTTRSAWADHTQPIHQQTREERRKEEYKETLKNLINIHNAIKKTVRDGYLSILENFEFINKHGNIINLNTNSYGQKMYLSESNKQKLEELRGYLSGFNSEITDVNHVALIVEVINEIYMIFKDNYRLFVRDDYKGPDTRTNLKESEEETNERIRRELSKHDQYLKNIFINGSFVDNQDNLENERFNINLTIHKLIDYIPKDTLRYDISDFIFFYDAQNKIQKRNISRQQARDAATQSQQRNEQREQNENTQRRLEDKKQTLEKIKNYITTLDEYYRNLQQLINQRNATLTPEYITEWTEYVGRIEHDLQLAESTINYARNFMKKYYQNGGSNNQRSVKSTRVTGTRERVQQSIDIRKAKRLADLQKRREERRARQEAEDKLIDRVKRLQSQIPSKIKELNDELNKVSAAL